MGAGCGRSRPLRDVLDAILNELGNWRPVWASQRKLLKRLKCLCLIPSGLVEAAALLQLSFEFSIAGADR
jgi:hypothetical protein